MGDAETETAEAVVLNCWCGESGNMNEMLDDSGLEEGCAGTGMVHCFCGGDFCVCHYHGEVECPGCEDCNEDDDREDGFDGEEHLF